jgi:hypothetical protein
MCGAETIDVSSFGHWVCHPVSVEKDIGGRLCSFQPTTALKTETKDKVDVPIWDDCHIMTNELCTAGGIAKEHYDDHQRTWLQKSLCKVDAENAHRQTQNSPKISVQNLFTALRKILFLSRMITYDKTWVHHFDPLTKRQ